MTVSGISKFDLKRQNRMQILRLLRTNGPISRIDIAREIHITKAAVTVITNEMIEQEILYEKGEQRATNVPVTRGRKKILLDINPTYKMDLGLVFDGACLYMGVCTLQGSIVEKHCVPLSPGLSADQATLLMKRLYEDILYKNDLSGSGATGLGVCYEAPSSLYGPGARGEAAFYKALKSFVGLPMVTGRLTEGEAIAEIEYASLRSAPTRNGNILLFNCSTPFSCTPVVGNEVYTGETGHSADLNGKELSLSDEGLLSRLQAVCEKERTPILWQAAEKTGGRLTALPANSAAFSDEPVQDLLSAFLNERVQAMLECIRLFDPGSIVLVGGREEDFLCDLLEARLSHAVKSLPGHCTVSRSNIRPSTRFLAGAALANRAFFLNRGGL